jgi:hypothetical protein
MPLVLKGQDAFAANAVGILRLFKIVTRILDGLRIGVSAIIWSSWNCQFSVTVAPLYEELADVEN